MYKITKVVINSSNTVVSTQLLSYAELDKENLPSIIGTLHNLVDVENKQYEIAGSNFRVKYIISQHIVIDYITLHKQIIDIINNTIISANTYINMVNVRIKRSNKKNNRKLNIDLLKPINPKYYFFINNYGVTIDENNNYIIE